MSPCGSGVPQHCRPYSGLLLQPPPTFSPHLTPHSCLPTCSSQLTHLPPTARPSPLALSSLLIQDRRPSPHTPTPSTPPHTPSTHSLMLHITPSSFQLAPHTLDIGVRGRGGAGGGNCPPKFGQNSGENLGKARWKKIMCKISAKSTPLPPLTEEPPYAQDSGHTYYVAE